MALRVITPPAIEPVTLEEAKLHARVDGADEDALLEVLIASARAHGESITRRAFVTQTLQLTLPKFPSNGGPIELPRPPFQAVTSVSYINTQGNVVVMDPLDYFALGASDAVPALLYPTPDDVWPETAVRPNAVVVLYTAGWPITDDLPTTPQAIRAWMLVRITSMYVQREKYVVGTGRDNLVALDRDFCDALLDQYTVLDVI